MKPQKASHQFKEEIVNDNELKLTEQQLYELIDQLVIVIKTNSQNLDNKKLFKLFISNQCSLVNISKLQQYIKNVLSEFISLSGVCELYKLHSIQHINYEFLALLSSVLPCNNQLFIHITLSVLKYGPLAARKLALDSVNRISSNKPLLSLLQTVEETAPHLIINQSIQFFKNGLFDKDNLNELHLIYCIFHRLFGSAMEIVSQFGFQLLYIFKIPLHPEFVAFSILPSLVSVKYQQFPHIYLTGILLQKMDLLQMIDSLDVDEIRLADLEYAMDKQEMILNIVNTHCINQIFERFPQLRNVTDFIQPELFFLLMLEAVLESVDMNQVVRSLNQMLFLSSSVSQIVFGKVSDYRDELIVKNLGTIIYNIPVQHRRELVYNYVQQISKYEIRTLHMEMLVKFVEELQKDSCSLILCDQLDLTDEFKVLLMYLDSKVSFKTPNLSYQFQFSNKVLTGFSNIQDLILNNLISLIAEGELVTVIEGFQTTQVANYIEQVCLNFEHLRSQIPVAQFQKLVVNAIASVKNFFNKVQFCAWFLKIALQFPEYFLDQILLSAVDLISSVPHLCYNLIEPVIRFEKPLPSWAIQLLIWGAAFVPTESRTELLCDNFNSYVLRTKECDLKYVAQNSIQQDFALRTNCVIRLKQLPKSGILKILVNEITNSNSLFNHKQDSILVFKKGFFILNSTPYKRQLCVVKLIRMLLLQEITENGNLQNIGEDLADQLKNTCNQFLNDVNWLRSSREGLEQILVIILSQSNNLLNDIENLFGCQMADPKKFAKQKISIQVSQFIIICVTALRAKLSETDKMQLLNFCFHFTMDSNHQLRCLSKAFCLQVSQIHNIALPNYVKSALANMENTGFKINFGELFTSLDPFKIDLGDNINHVLLSTRPTIIPETQTVGNCQKFCQFDQFYQILNDRRYQETLKTEVNNVFVTRSRKAEIDRSRDQLVEVQPGEQLDAQQKIQYLEKEKFDVIVVCTLLDNGINLGGIARTAEIFNAKQMVVADLEILKTPFFIGTAVSAASKLNIIEVTEPNLSNWLNEKKKSGYSIIALEQSQRSILLNEAKIPDKCVIVLGNESLGCPDRYLNMCDMTIEIPQFGAVRSLNVHVSFSVLMWNWIQQHKLGK